MKNDRTFLGHILKAIDDIGEFIGNRSYEDFARDKKTCAAVIRQLEIIGEAASYISEQCAIDIPDFPADKMIGMRNILIHEYFGVNLRIVWDTCTEDIPKLQRIVRHALDQMEK